MAADGREDDALTDALEAAWAEEPAWEHDAEMAAAMEADVLDAEEGGSSRRLSVFQQLTARDKGESATLWDSDQRSGPVGWALFQAHGIMVAPEDQDRLPPAVVLLQENEWHTPLPAVNQGKLPAVHAGHGTTVEQATGATTGARGLLRPLTTSVPLVPDSVHLNSSMKTLVFNSLGQSNIIMHILICGLPPLSTCITSILALGSFTSAPVQNCKLPGIHPLLLFKYLRYPVCAPNGCRWVVATLNGTSLCVIAVSNFHPYDTCDIVTEHL